MSVGEELSEEARAEWCISGGNAENAAYRCRNIPEDGEILCYYCLESHRASLEIETLRKDLERARSIAVTLEQQNAEALRIAMHASDHAWNGPDDPEDALTDDIADVVRVLGAGDD